PIYVGKQGSSRGSTTLQVSLLAGSFADKEKPALQRTDVVPKKNTPPILTPKPGDRGDDGVGTPSDSHNYRSAGNLSRMPEAITEFLPQLTSAEDSGTGGQIAVRLWISETGGVDDAGLLESALPSAYADAALAAFRQMRFVPGEVDGKPVKV